MYKKLIGKNLKIIFQDGDKVLVFNCSLLNYDDELKTLEILNKKNNETLFISAKEIIKLEVVDNGLY